MIKFMCDSCGKDISSKIHDSVRQFCAKDFFKQDLSKDISQGSPGQLRDVQYEVGHAHGPLNFQVQLLAELSKIIHSSAWDMRSARMHCSSCAVKHVARKKERVVTIFTTIGDKLQMPETEDAAISQTTN